MFALRLSFVAACACLANCQSGPAALFVARAFWLAANDASLNQAMWQSRLASPAADGRKSRASFKGQQMDKSNARAALQADVVKCLLGARTG